MMKKIAKLLGALILALVLLAAGAFAWGKSASATKLAAHVETHRDDFPIPFPPSEEELAELKAKAGPDAPIGEPELQKITLERAIALAPPARGPGASSLRA